MIDYVENPDWLVGCSDWGQVETATALTAKSNCVIQNMNIY